MSRNGNSSSPRCRELLFSAFCLLPSAFYARLGDLYRVETPHELETVGLEECLQGDGVCVIEWAERAAGWLPQDRLVVEIEETGPQARRLRLVPYGRRYTELVAGLAQKAEGRRQKAE